MSSRRSDILAHDGSGRTRALLVNLPVIAALLVLIPIQKGIDAGWIDPYYLRVAMLIGFNIILAVSLQLINGFSGQFSLGHAGFMAVGAYLAAFPAIQYSRDLHDPGSTLLFFLSLWICVTLGVAILWALLALLRQSRRIHRSLPGILLTALIVWIVVDFAVAANGTAHGASIWARLPDALTGLFATLQTRCGPAAARLSTAIPEAARPPICFLVLLIGGGICAAAVGFVVGLPTLRLRGDYLAIATLGLAEIIRIAIQNSQPLGGALGLVGIPKYTNFAWLYGAVIVTVVVIWRIAYSPKGRAIMAVREDEIAAASIGVNTTRYKVMAFVVGAFFAGAAGGLFSLFEMSITPNYFGLLKSIEPVVMVTLGGLGSVSGAIVAAAVLTALPEVLRSISPEDRMVIYSLLLVVMMIVRPQGLLGGRELWPRRRGPRRVPVPTGAVGA